MATVPEGRRRSGGGGGRRIIAVALGAAIVLVALAGQGCVSREPAEVTASPSVSPAPATGAIPRAVPSPSRLEVVPFDTALVLAAMDDTYAPQATPQIARLIRALPPRSVTAGGPIPDLINGLYGLTATSHPETYTLLESEIRRLNPALTSGQAGPVLVPALPHAWTGPASGRRRYDLIVRSRAQDGADARQVGDLEMRTLADEEPRSRSVMRIRMPVAELATPAMSDLIAQPENTLVSFPLNVTFAQSGCNQAYKPFVDQTKVQQALGKASRDVTLYILDAGWPDEKAWWSSRQHLAEMCATLRDRYLMPPPAVGLEAQGKFPPLSNGSTHPLHIQHALQVFEGLNTHVRVVYVPMVRDQGAEDVLTELLALRYFRGDLASGGNTPPGAIAQAQRARMADEARAEARKLLLQIPGPPKGGALTKVDGGLVSALLQVATAHVRESKGTFFVNESWWSTDTRISLDVAPVRGFVVAAAGNEKGKVVDAEPVTLFAGTASSDGQTLAVMTLDQNGAETCCTSVVDYKNPQLAAAGYYGVVDDKTCGSSFASPRVAWILAARETLHTDPIEYPSAWASQIKQRLRSQQGTGPRPAALLFDPLRYLNE